MKKITQFQGKNIIYNLSGKGPALVLLHGFIESKRIWDDFTETLCKQFTVIAVDLPGHGESSLLAETHSMQLMAEAVKAVLQAEKIESAVITGHSMGGYVALQFAVDNTELVKGLVLFHSHAAADSEETKVNRRRTIQIVRQNRGGFIKQFIPDLFDPDHVAEYNDAIADLQDQAALMAPEAIIAALQGMRDRSDRIQYLELTRIPVLFIIGKRDSRMPSNQLLVQAAIPSHSETLLLEGVGHMGFIEAPEKTLKALEYFTLRCFQE